MKKTAMIKLSSVAFTTGLLMASVIQAADEKAFVCEGIVTNKYDDRIISSSPFKDMVLRINRDTGQVCLPTWCGYIRTYNNHINIFWDNEWDRGTGVPPELKSGALNRISGSFTIILNHPNTPKGGQNLDIWVGTCSAKAPLF